MRRDVIVAALPAKALAASASHVITPIVFLHLGPAMRALLDLGDVSFHLADVSSVEHRNIVSLFNSDLAVDGGLGAGRRGMRLFQAVEANNQTASAGDWKTIDFLIICGFQMFGIDDQSAAASDGRTPFSSDVGNDIFLALAKQEDVEKLPRQQSQKRTPIYFGGAIKLGASERRSPVGDLLLQMHEPTFVAEPVAFLCAFPQSGRGRDG